ncbi:MAG: hypothetical protein ACLFSY_00620 [Desulfonatronovibrionaceae bacterium]
MEQIQKQTLQVAKEIVVKFIEIGRISPSNFGEHFSSIYREINKSVLENTIDPGEGQNGRETDEK